MNRMLALSGADIVERDLPVIQILSAPQHLSHRRSLDVDLIVVSLFEYSEAYARHHSESSSGSLQKHKPDKFSSKNFGQKTREGSDKSTEPDSPVLTDAEIRMLHNVMKGSSSSSSLSSSNGTAKTPQVVSVDWFFSCLQAGALLDINSLDIFTMPPSPIVHPFAHKSKRSGERYTKYDTVYYSMGESSSSEPKSNTTTAKSSKRVRLKDMKVGMIMEFTTAAADREERETDGASSVQVTVRPLQSWVDSQELSPQSLRARLGRTNCEGVPLDMAKELLLADPSSEFTIDETMLRDKAVLLDRELYCSVQYVLQGAHHSTLRDVDSDEYDRGDIYFADAMLENWRNEEGKDLNSSFMSQDY